MTTVRLTARLTAEIDRRQATADARRHAFRLVADVTRQTFNRANVLTPVRTGNLRAHNRMGVIRQTATQVSGEVFNTAEYAEAVHDGTRPHVIRARRAKALRFKMRGRFIYRAKVRHPGTRGRPWLAEAGRQVATANGFRWERR